MLMKNFLVLIFILAASAAMAQEDYFCERPGSTSSYGIELNAFERDGDQYAAVRIVQYPTEKIRFYKITRQTRTQAGMKTDMNGPELQFQADRDLVLREGSNETTLETFWITGCTGFCTGGQSGSVLYNCKETR